MERDAFVAELIDKIAEKLADAQREVYFQLLREKLGVSPVLSGEKLVPPSGAVRHVLHRVVTARDVAQNAVIFVRRDAIITHQASARAAELGATLKREEEGL